VQSAGTDTSRPVVRFLFATLQGHRRLQVIAGDEELERWVRAWARRYYLVEATSEKNARFRIAGYEHACAKALGKGPLASRFGILEAGRNAPGGPTEFPRPAHGRASGAGERAAPGVPAHGPGRRPRARAPAQEEMHLL
jgi:hypothetical protein